MPYIGNIVQDFSVNNAMLNTDSVTSIKIDDGTIVNADINASAAIAGTKIDPSFTSNITITNNEPKLILTDSGDNPDFEVKNQDGTFVIKDTTNNANRLFINTDGHTDIKGNLDCEAGLDVTGNITVTGTVDGVDIAVLNTTVGTKLPFTGGTLTGNLAITREQPIISFNDSTDNPDYYIGNIDGAFRVRDTTNNSTRLDITASTTTISNNLDVGAGLDVTGAITGTAAITLGNGSGLNWGDTSARIRGESGSSGLLRFDTNSSERMRIDSSGNVGIGTTSPNVLGNDAQHTIFSIIETSGTRRGQIELGDNQNVDGGGIGDIHFVGHYQSSSHKDMACIKAVSSGSTSGQRGSYLAFETKTDGVAAIAERMRIDSSGKVGIGTASPLAILHLNDSANNGEGTLKIGGNTDSTTTGATFFYEISGSTFLRIKNLYRSNGSNGNNANIEYDAGFHNFLTGTGGNERMRIDSSGRLLIGATSSRTIANHAPRLQLQGTDYQTATFSIINNANAGNGAFLYFATQRSGSVGGSTVVQANDSIGTIRFFGGDGSNINSYAAQIQASIDGTPGSSDMPGRLTFSTTADGSSGPTERMRISSSGKVGIGTSSPVEILHIKEDTNKNVHFTGGIGQIGNVTGLFAVNDANDAIVDIGICGTTVRVGTTAGERARFTGDGLCFNGDTAAANALTDYEEGTFTLAASAMGVTNTNCKYVKIGRLVHCTGELDNGSSGNGALVAQYSGLPFAGQSGTESQGQGGTIPNHEFGVTALTSLVSSSSMRVVNGTGSHLTQSVVDDKNMKFNITYYTT